MTWLDQIHVGDCRCGERRHMPDAYHYCRGEWVSGAHPKADELRAREQPGEGA